MQRRCVLILLDGLGDRSYACLDDRTPLAAARTPCLDRLASLGASGLYHATRPGVALPSEMAHYALFGYDCSDFPGRGPLEALGAGVDLGPEDVALLAHFVSVREERGRLRLIEDVPKVSAEEAPELMDTVAAFEHGGVRLELHQTGGVFGVLVMRGNVSPWITDTGTMREGTLLPRPRVLAEHEPNEAARRASRALQAYLLMAFSKLSSLGLNGRRERLGLRSVNCLVTQRAGRLRTLPPFTALNGLRALMLAEGAMYRGLARYLGMEHDPERVLDGPEKEIVSLLKRARARKLDYDFIHVHTKAPDRAAHAKNPAHKRDAIEALDRGLEKEIAPLLDDPEILLVVTADHSTPSGGELVHSGEPVPLMLVGEGVRRDRVSRFDEVEAACGSLGLLRGEELMLMILNHLDRSRLAGIRESPLWSRYWPSSYEPLMVEQESDDES